MKFKNYFASHKLRLAYTFLILAFVVAACNYPVTQHESAGDVMKWSVSNDNTEAIQKIESMEWLKTGEYNVNVENVNGKEIVTYNLVLPKENHSSVQDYRNQLESINGVNDVQIIPLNETVKRPVYAVLLNDLFKIDINATNMSDAELEKEITSQLKNAGIEVVTFNFERDKEGRRIVKVVIPENQMKKDGGFDMTIKDGEKITKMKEVRKTGSGDPDRFKGKSDEEVREMVKEDLGNPDIKDDEIQIIREDDKVRVKVNVNRDGK
jgi:phosphoribosylformylglycinamidine (FGAM) synthase PurS component